MGHRNEISSFFKIKPGASLLEMVKQDVPYSALIWNKISRQRDDGKVQIMRRFVQHSDQLQFRCIFMSLQLK